MFFYYQWEAIFPREIKINERETLSFSLMNLSIFTIYEKLIVLFLLLSIAQSNDFSITIFSTLYDTLCEMIQLWIFSSYATTIRSQFVVVYRKHTCAQWTPKLRYRFEYRILVCLLRIRFKQSCGCFEFANFNDATWKVLWARVEALNWISSYRAFRGAASYSAFTSKT